MNFQCPCFRCRCFDLRRQDPAWRRKPWFVKCFHTRLHHRNTVNTVATQRSKINLSLLRTQGGLHVGEAAIVQSALYFHTTKLQRTHSNCCGKNKSMINIKCLWGLNSWLVDDLGFCMMKENIWGNSSGVWMSLLRHMVPNAACFQIGPCIWRHHLTGKAITLTCGVRQLLSLVPGLRILLSSAKQRKSVKLTTLGVTEKSPEWTETTLRSQYCISGAQINWFCAVLGQGTYQRFYSDQSASLGWCHALINAKCIAGAAAIIVALSSSRPIRCLRITPEGLLRLMSEYHITLGRPPPLFVCQPHMIQSSAGV